MVVDEDNLRLVCVVNDLQPYGGQRVAVRLAEEFARGGHECVLIYFSTVGVPRLAVDDAVRLVAIDRRRKGILGALQLVVDLRREIQRISPDAVLSHMVFSNMLAVCAVRSSLRRRVALVVVEHSVPENVRLGARSHVVARARGFLYRFPEKVVAVSDHVRRKFQESIYGQPGRVVAVQNPVDIELFQERARLAVVDHPWLRGSHYDRAVVCVGGFRPAKGQDVLLRALALAPRLRVIFVGDGPLLEEMIDLSSELDVARRVDFVGYSDSVEAYMREAAALVVPSRAEGFGLVIVEAGALGRPVVCADLPSLKELVPDLVPGATFPAEDFEQLARILSNGDYPDGAADFGGLDRFLPVSVAAQYLSIIRDSLSMLPANQRL